VTEVYPKKIIEIVVENASNLRINGNMQSQMIQRRMLPFFTYDFYSFSYTSAAVQSNNPHWNVRRQYEVEANPEYLQYMKNNVLKIDFIDESVDINQPGQRDYIGSARIPLIELWSKSKIDSALPFPIMDENDREAGAVAVKMAVHDAAKFVREDAFGDQTTSFVGAKRIHTQVVNKVAEKLAQAEFDDFNILLDMLFSKDRTNQNRVDRQQLCDFLITDMSVPIHVKDLELFMKTHEAICDKQLYERSELRSIFERPFKEAREAQIVREANRPQYPRATNVQRFAETGFGVSGDRANRPTNNPMNSGATFARGDT